MSTNRRKFLWQMAALSGATLFGQRAMAAQRAMALTAAINKAGRQRMLSQRITKAYCQLGLGVVTDQSFNILHESIGLFDSQLAELVSYAPTEQIRATYAQLSGEWDAFRRVALEKPTHEGAVKLAEMNERVLRVAHAGTTQLEGLSHSHVGQLVNVAGRQRMLSQRVAKFYMLRAWEVPVVNIGGQLSQARREFVSAMAELRVAKENTPLINQDLELARSQWAFYEVALDYQAGGTHDPKLEAAVATSSERVLEVMNEVTGLYEHLSET